MAFLPQEGSLRLVSAAEDMLVKVWDLVLSTEIATIRPTQAGGRATCFAFSNDFKTLMVASRDSTIAFLNTHNDFKLIHTIKCNSTLGFASDEEEVNALVYLNFGSQTSYLAIGSTSGQLVILDLATMEPCFTEKNFIASETIFLKYRKTPNNACGQLICLNMDQNLFIYDIKEKAMAKGSLKRKVSLTKSGSLCLYLDEVIDVRFISETSKYALLCSNSETLKLLNMDTN